MLRVAGTDPGTSSLDVLVLEDGAVRDQARFLPEELQADATLPVRWLDERGPFDLITGPSGYGLPLVAARDCDDRDLALMTLLRPDDQGGGRQGVLGFTAVVRALRVSALPVVFLPGVIQLPSIPAYRKINRIDLGTADKLCVAVLAIDRVGAGAAFCVMELGSAFTACLVVREGKVVDGLGGSSGPPGWRSGGAWDGEAAYLLSPLAKQDLFTGGVQSIGVDEGARLLFRESLLKAVAGLQAVTAFEQVVLSGRLLELEPAFVEQVTDDLSKLGSVTRLESLPGAWVKQAAQGAALTADGLAGGSRAALVEGIGLRAASGSVLDWLRYPRAHETRSVFGVGK
jgi:predicted butyrate kinase (DUF1464 family)